MRSEILDILNQVKPGVNYETENNLIEDGILESFDLVTLVSLLNDKFDIMITVSDLVPENFESVDAIEKMVNNLK